MLDETLKGNLVQLWTDTSVQVANGSGIVLGVETVQHSTQTEFLPFLALPDSLAGKRIAYVVLDDE